MVSQSDMLDLMRKMLLRGEASSFCDKYPQPVTTSVDIVDAGYSIGYSFNLLNNSYVFCKIARKYGVDARLFLETNFAETSLTALPWWEEQHYLGDAIPAVTARHFDDKPEFITTSRWSLAPIDGLDLAACTAQLASIMAPTGITVNDLYSTMLAFTIAPHQELLWHYNTADILHVSGSHIGVASFTDKPYVTFPFGGDLFSLPFDDNELGWMQARGFRKATRHIVSGEIMLEYMVALGIPSRKIDLLPFMLDTDIYAPLTENPVRDQLRREHPGKTIFFIGARQNWGWKGNDKLYRAIAALPESENALFLTVWYGQDTGKSDQLIEELGISNRIVKVGVMSKPTLRQYIDAADVCIDQFTHGGLGTFSLESLSCGTPLMTYYDPAKHFHFDRNPPLLDAFSVDEIKEKLGYCLANRAKLPEIGNESRAWLCRYHGHEALWPQYNEVYLKALVDRRYR